MLRSPAELNEEIASTTMSRRRLQTNANANATAIPSEPMSVREKARRLRARGDGRKAITLLREACMRDESDAALWTLYGVLAARAGRVDDGAQALRHAVWLRKSQGDRARMTVTQALLDRLALPNAA